MLDKPLTPYRDKNHKFHDEIRTLEACFAALPTPSAMKKLIADSQAADARGYYDPEEDDRLRETYMRYLGIRSAIWSIIQSLKPHYKDHKNSAIALTGDNNTAFAIAFAGAEIIVKTGEYLIDLARERDIVWKKLDEAEPRYRLKRKSFNRLYRQLTSALKMKGFYTACDYFDANRPIILSQLETQGHHAIIKILTSLNLPSVSRGDHLRRYRRFVNFSLKRRGISSLNKSVFAVFEATGSDIAELKIPLVKPAQAPKRVTPQLISRLKPKLQPGDVFITRHDDAMSNLFLPGFWPHGALFIGDPDVRKPLGVNFAQDGLRNTTNPDINIIEAKKDGVLLRAIEETLQVDAFVVLRPQLAKDDIAEALNRALSHAGKLYDFIFDFSTSDRLVCTEVIYRAYQGVGPIQFLLSQKAGRHCLSAEDFLNQAIGHNWFKPIIICNVGNHDWVEGDVARHILKQSFQSEF
jgi:hypothetical protein